MLLGLYGVETNLGILRESLLGGQEIDATCCRVRSPGPHLDDLLVYSNLKLMKVFLRVLENWGL